MAADSRQLGAKIGFLAVFRYDTIVQLFIFQASVLMTLVARIQSEC
jgi:hypothetical protein